MISTSPKALSRAYSSAASSENDPRMPITPILRRSPTAAHLRGGAGERGAAPIHERSTVIPRSEEHTSELQSRPHLVCRLLLEKKNEANRSTWRTERIRTDVAG